MHNCQNCKEKCPQAELAHEAAKGRMYATNEFIVLLKKVESGQLVEVVRCKDCKYWGDEAGKLKCSDGVLFARCKVHNYLIDGRHTGWCPTENDFCSYGERKECAD